jgi:hypothetical protein
VVEQVRQQLADGYYNTSEAAARTAEAMQRGGD